MVRGNDISKEEMLPNCDNNSFMLLSVNSNDKSGNNDADDDNGDDTIGDLKLQVT